MANMEKISVSLTSEMTAMLNAAVASGDYASHSEIIREALRKWRDSNMARSWTTEELRQKWQEGIDSGIGRYVSPKELMAKARKQFEQNKHN